jgi:release factor glutamine methyltransferase
VTIRELRAQAHDALIAHELGVSRAWLRAHEDAPVDPERAERVRAAALRHAAGEPLAYILGTTGFYRREFFVDSRVLIPRPETEHLCEVAVAFLQTLDAPRALDVGTGSGAIACTIAAEVPHAHVDAVDSSAAALEVAAENRKRLHLEHRVAFYYGDLLEPVAGKRYDAVIANLPYVPQGDGDDTLRYEPADALYAGPEGLDAYRRFFAQAPAAVSPGGIVLAEGAPPVAEGLLALAQAAFPGARVTLERDYGGRDRFVKVETSKVETPGESE